MTPHFWRDRRVFVTGHTGFKGSWLVAWLRHLGAEVTGYALAPPSSPSLFETLTAEFESIEADVRDLETLRKAMRTSQPEVVIHLAAQSLVRASYEDPINTYTTNVIGTANVLEAARTVDGMRVALIVTSDKCYEPRAGHAFTEDDPLGGRDPYASSKACAELVTSAYRQSFFGNGPRILSARAGNVLGGGDWSRDRLVPDLVRAFQSGEGALIRNPDATRPWQFVLDALHGYLTFVESAFERADLSHSLNFGPAALQSKSVRWLADTMSAQWGNGATWQAASGPSPHEAATLEIDSSRARNDLGWKPMLDAEDTVAWTTAWYQGTETLDSQIARFEERIGT